MWLMLLLPLKYSLALSGVEMLLLYRLFCWGRGMSSITWQIGLSSKPTFEKIETKLRNNLFNKEMGCKLKFYTEAKLIFAPLSTQKKKV